MTKTPRGGGGMKSAPTQAPRHSGMPSIQTGFKNGPSKQINVSIKRPGSGIGGSRKGCC